MIYSLSFILPQDIEQIRAECTVCWSPRKWPQIHLGRLEDIFEQLPSYKEYIHSIVHALLTNYAKSPEIEEQLEKV